MDQEKLSLKFRSDGLQIVEKKAALRLVYEAREIREKTIRVIGPDDRYWKYRVWFACHRQNRNDALIKRLSLSFKEICDRSSG